ncbi:Uncharacterised protein [uncultured archaeon]|nr:Uncharacterised protein [uncultured archaeon]
MGLFNKKEGSRPPANPPKLPELPPIYSDREYSATDLPQLPSFPNNSFGEKISQSAIKQAVSGKEEVDRGFDADESEENWMMPKPQKRSFTQELPFVGKSLTRDVASVPKEFEAAEHRVRNVEPVFVRLDKFEESLHTFKKTKEKITEIERMLDQTKHIKEQEEKELEYWEMEIQKIKEQIEKIDRDIFSKVQ